MQSYKKKILGAVSVDCTTGNNVPIELEALIGTSYRDGGVEVTVYAPADNEAIVRLIGDDSSTIGIVRPSGSTIVLPDHIVGDDVLYVRGTTGDSIEVGVYGILNPASYA